MLKELGEYKNRLQSLFVNSDNICNLLLGKGYEDRYDDLDNELEKYIIPHLYIPETVDNKKSYILFETYCRGTTGQTKNMQIVIQSICHKEAVSYEKKPKGYYGLRYDVLAQFIEELLCPTDKNDRNSIIKKFGIGSLELKSVDVFLSADKFIGRTLTFSVPDFR